MARTKQTARIRVIQIIVFDPLDKYQFSIRTLRVFNGNSASHAIAQELGLTASHAEQLQDDREEDDDPKKVWHVYDERRGPGSLQSLTRNKVAEHVLKQLDISLKLQNDPVGQLFGRVVMTTKAGCIEEGFATSIRAYVNEMEKKEPVSSSNESSKNSAEASSSDYENSQQQEDDEDEESSSSSNSSKPLYSASYGNKVLVLKRNRVQANLDSTEEQPATKLQRIDENSQEAAM